MYQRILHDLTLPSEGGWYDGKQERDPNPTMKGVTQRTYDTHRKRMGWSLRSVREISEFELEDIYREYWQDCRGPRILTLFGADDEGAELAATVFDHAVNSGPRSSIRLLQEITGSHPDGRWGPQTEAYLTEFVYSFGVDFTAALHNLRRMSFYLSLADSQPRHRPNLRSWIRRLALHRFLYLQPKF